ncbi:regulatory protein RecX [Novosphingobium sp. 9]|uniref:regulatory protein RecX n=1 Tax=Novosphingobium sp. 9 TaxID=2025349 RepID=UPI0028CBA554|nr:RecX family transcriptional regulator [Novosphingobium sp. 9]
MALAYVARFATTQGKLRAYLQRKVQERGWSEDADCGVSPAAPVIEALVEKFREAGYVDDVAWARMKSGSLSRRGYGARRVAQALRHAGVDAQGCEEAAPGRSVQAEAAVALARRRRFGPFSREVPDRPLLEKQLAAMLRAGHGQTTARHVLEAQDEAALDEWVEVLREEDREGI